jgi:hypothetical protein
MKSGKLPNATFAVSLCFFLYAAGNQRERSPGKYAD